jgi:2-polyprenyl-3-methyl-5-hydroxy-6-metoxy-1,4-benzoquinol methylase
MPGSAPLLDFGCGVGFLVKSLQNLKYFTYGYDPSPWPVEHGSSVLGIEHLTTDYNKAIGPWEWYEAVTALDVFEHMKPDDVRHFLRNVKTRYLIVRIPVCLRDGEDFFCKFPETTPRTLPA